MSTYHFTASTDAELLALNPNLVDVCRDTPPIPSHPHDFQPQFGWLCLCDKADAPRIIAALEAAEADAQDEKL